MKRAFACAFLLLSTPLLATHGNGASITYDLVDYPALQNGYTLSGTITTDGTLGILKSPDILAWQFTVTGGGGFIHVADTDPGALILVAGPLTASQTLITLPPPGNDFVYSNFLLGGDSSGIALSYYHVPGLDYYGFQANNNVDWSASGSRPSPLSLGGDPWVIATAEPAAVPEPSSLVQAGAAGVMGLALVWRRRRRNAA